MDQLLLSEDMTYSGIRTRAFPRQIITGFAEEQFVLTITLADSGRRLLTITLAGSGRRLLTITLAGSGRRLTSHLNPNSKLNITVALRNA